MLRLRPARPVIGNASPPTDTSLTSQAPFLTIILLRTDPSNRYVLVDLIC